MKEEKKLYLVKSVNQQTGEDLEMYYLVDNLMQLKKIADIIEIKPLTPFEDLTSDEFDFEATT